MNRSSGVFLNISSLPSKDGIGTFGKEAYRFVDFLKKAGFSYWQILPTNPTGFGDSPYQSFSTFAGNPYYIDLEMLKKDNLLSDNELQSYNYKNDDSIEYGLLYKEKFKVLRKAFDRGYKKLVNEVIAFRNENNFWIEDYSLFMAIKDHLNGCCLLDWPKDIKERKQKALNYYKNLLKEDVDFYVFIQFLFHKQFSKLKSYMVDSGIKLIGDIPIYVSMDSSDVWANKDLFKLDKNYVPKLVAGVPPDYFSEEGQLWGNPIYNYRKMKEDNYNWWVQRVKNISQYCDVVRIDHFRGFESYYAVKYGAKNAINGRWIKGPGIELFNAIRTECDIQIIAEDLGFITRSVKKLMRECEFPGMKVLQFAFDGRKNNEHLPKNHTPNSVCYIGTHDNHTLKGFVDTLSSKQNEYVRSRLRLKKGPLDEIFIKTLFKSKSNLCIINACDMLKLDDNFRMNIPATAKNNWVFRLLDFEYLFKTKNKYYKLNKKTNRL